MCKCCTLYHINYSRGMCTRTQSVTLTRTHQPSWVLIIPKAEVHLQKGQFISHPGMSWAQLGEAALLLIRGHEAERAPVKNTSSALHVVAGVDIQLKINHTCLGVT